MSMSWWEGSKSSAGPWDEPLAQVLSTDWNWMGHGIVIIKSIKRNGEIIFKARWSGSIHEDEVFYFDVDPQDRMIAEMYHAQQQERKKKGKK